METSAPSLWPIPPMQASRRFSNTEVNHSGLGPQGKAGSVLPDLLIIHAPKDDDELFRPLSRLLVKIDDPV